MRTVYIPTHNRAGSATTPHLLSYMGFNPIFLVHDAEQKSRYESAYPLYEIIDTQTPGKGRSAQVMHILGNAKAGEYYLFAEDDILSFRAVIQPYRYEMPIRGKFDKEVFTENLQEVRVSIWETITRAEKGHYLLYGMSNTENAFFVYSSKRYTEDTLVNGAFFGIQSGEWCKPVMQIWDDVELSLLAMQNGRTLIDNAVKARNQMYMEGGHSQGKERDRIDAEGLETLSQMFPGVLTYEKRRIGYKIEVNKKNLRNRGQLTLGM